MVSPINAKDKAVLYKQIAISQSILNQNGPTNVYAQDVPRVTIWIHGTKALSMVGDYVHATPYPGLIAVSELSWMYRLKRLLNTLASTHPMQCHPEHLYVFGWSGTLSFEARKSDAHNLYQALKQLNHDYQIKYGKKPIITIITHSHGGNVVLNLAKVKESNTEFKVRAILMACPVQHATKHLVKDPIFELIYSLYSHADILQILDPQGLYTYETHENIHFELSDRIFPYAPNLRQACIAINGHKVSHLGFFLERFVKIIPNIIHALEIWEREEPSTSDQERILNIELNKRRHDD